MKKTIFVSIIAVTFTTNIGAIDGKFTAFGNHREALGLSSQGTAPQEVNQRVKDIAQETEVQVTDVQSTVKELFGKINDAVKYTNEVSESVSDMMKENKPAESLTKEEMDNIVQKLTQARDVYKDVTDKEKLYRKALLDSNRELDKLVKKSHGLLDDVRKELETTVAKFEKLNGKNPRTKIEQDNVDHLNGVSSILKTKVGVIEKFNNDMEEMSKGADTSKEDVERLLNQIRNSVELLRHAVDVLRLSQDLNDAKNTFKSARQINELVQKIADSLRKMTDNLNLILVTANSM